VHLTTITLPALIIDLMILGLYWKAFEDCDRDTWRTWLYVLLCWMFVSKFLKNMGHYVRYPVDFALLPVSILFGYFHGIIKVHALLSLNVVSSPMSCVRASLSGLARPFLFSQACPPPPHHSSTDHSPHSPLHLPLHLQFLLTPIWGLGLIP
jgi:hypothetical protein